MEPEDFLHTSVHKGFSQELSIEDLLTGEVLPSSTWAPFDKIKLLDRMSELL